MSLLQTKRRCQGYNQVAERCDADGVTRFKGKWVCDEHAALMRSAGSALVQVEVGRCPACGTSTHREVVQEQPLVRHGGYGAARRTVTEHCPNAKCRWWLTTDVSEERPERTA